MKLQFMATVLYYSDPILKAQPHGLSAVSSLLTYPVRDVDGDYLSPSGGQWNPTSLVNWEHQCPIGRGTVAMKGIPVEGSDSPIPCPVGTTKFFSNATHLKGVPLERYRINSNGTRGKQIGAWTVDDCLRAADEAHELVEADQALGVSVEFLTLKAFKTGHVSDLTGRPCMDVDEWKLIAWAHCAHPRNPFAQVIENDVITKAFTTADTGRLPSGKPITSEIILKSYAPLRGRLPRKAMSRGVTLKAFDDPAEMAGDGIGGAIDESAASDPAMDDMGDGMGDMGTPTIAGQLFDGAQAAADVCQMLEDLQTASAPSGDYTLKPKLAKLLAKVQPLCEELRSWVDSLNALAEKAEAAAGDGDGKTEDRGEKEEKEAPEDEDAGEESAAEESDDDTDDVDAALKAIPPRTQYDADGRIITKSGYRPRRFKMSELKPVEQTTDDDSEEIDTAALKALQEDVSSLAVMVRRKARVAALNQR